MEKKFIEDNWNKAENKTNDKLKDLLLFLMALFGVVILYILFFRYTYSYIFKENKSNQLINQEKNPYLSECKSKFDFEFNKLLELVDNNENEINLNNNIKNFLVKINNIFLNGSISSIITQDNNSLSNQSYQKSENTEDIIDKYSDVNIESEEYKSENIISNKFRDKNIESEEYIKEYSIEILKGYSKIYNKNYKEIKTIIFEKIFNLGNALFTINNLIYYCEILHCKNIYLSKQYWFVKKPVYNKELDITISPLNINSWDKETTLYIGSSTNFNNVVKLFNDIDKFIPYRNYLFQNELLSNMKLIETNDNDLIINIRSGKDIFENKVYSPSSYVQPPLCFYQTIIETFHFDKIYLLANGKENPVVNELIKLYPNIIYIHGTVEEDAGVVLSAKNLVLPISSFTVELMKFSNNLKTLFEFNITTTVDKKFWHYTDRHLKPFKFNRFIMNPTKEYTNIMIPWGQKKNQFSQMINEKCDKKFKIMI